MKQANFRTRRRTQLLGMGPHLFGAQGYIAHRRLARRLPEDGERLVTTAELRSFNL